ncbi:hypothetical protein BDA99DRAFT_531133 [Phascolomyces articulosus]|uniref:Uncharacterized protein n=1 Tax=Phascolomyces articulosus TaxID=60185 RepID=A0AAD5KYI5_9FUNG|nr:hypothetical protein BDA99DRAFT_531133 [Phascolomyces articulosus]
MTIITDVSGSNTKSTMTIQATHGALFNILPFDIQFNTFSRFSKTECLQCMQIYIGYQQITPFLLQTAPTIKHLALEEILKNQTGTIPINKNWSFISRSFYAPQLCSLILGGIPYDNIGTLMNMLVDMKFGNDYHRKPNLS